jgi:hypothetical protein
VFSNTTAEGAPSLRALFAQGWDSTVLSCLALPFKPWVPQAAHSSLVWLEWGSSVAELILIVPIAKNISS